MTVTGVSISVGSQQIAYYEQHVGDQLARHIVVAQQVIDEQASQIAHVATLLINCYRRGNKGGLCGNGDSAANVQHVAAELLVAG